MVDAQRNIIPSIRFEEETANLQGHITMIFGQICVRESQTCSKNFGFTLQTAMDFFTKITARRFAIRKKQPLPFSEGIFL